MKKIYKILVLLAAYIILSADSQNLSAQPDPPSLPDQHGYNGNQSPQGVPLDGGTEVLLVLVIAYAVKKLSERERRTIAGR